jgi:hypothetical protein
LGFFFFRTPDFEQRVPEMTGKKTQSLTGSFTKPKSRCFGANFDSFFFFCKQCARLACKKAQELDDDDYWKKKNSHFQ